MRFVFKALTLGLLLTLPHQTRAGDDGLTGYWKVTVDFGRQPTAIWLLHIQSKDGKITATGDPLKGAPKVKIEDAKVVGDLLTMRLNATLVQRGKQQVIPFDFEGKLPKPGAKKIFGSLYEDGELFSALLESTTAKSPFELDRDLLMRTPTDPRALTAIMDVIEKAHANKVPAEDLQKWVESSLASAELYGPRIQLKHQVQLLDALKAQKAYSAVAIATARKISKQIDPKSPLETQLQLLSSITDLLREGGEKQEAQALEGRVEKLEGQAYTDYSKSALNFKTEKYAGRKGKSTRAVLVELFTGAQCPPCVAADMAFDGVEKTYGPAEVVLLQYHMHIPRPEPMANGDSDARFDFYAFKYEKQVRGTPASLFNGKPDASGGGSKDDAPERYKDYCEAINKLLETATTVKLSATASRKEDKITIKAKVQDLDKPGAKVRLRFALVEDWVRFKGGNGLQYHHRVVRALPGGVEGMALKEKDSEHTSSVDLAALRTVLNKYLDTDYPEGTRPMRLRNLSVVAFVQNDESTEVLQAVNVPVREE